ncbi:isoaspartyl peptidase/L-asparaginase [Xanthomonas euvesicatoria]|nr:isoaspartyl peptidase/L-asparaginase [Xanthomonas euvesicatoria]
MLVIHGGAGVEKSSLSKDEQAQAREAMQRALRAGHAVLNRGGSAVDAVAATIIVLEDAPQFNAGRGAVFTHDGRNELDAAIMDGASGKAGDRQAQAQLDLETAKHFGTVGALALDRDGHLAAGTSTGGMTNKRYGRVGDAPIIGAGTYANSQCAVSGTGWGEFYIRAVAAYDICARMKYAGQSLQQAAETVIDQQIPKAGGDGGAIALDAQGNLAFPFNTEGMYRGWIGADGTPHVAIFKDETL